MSLYLSRLILNANHPQAKSEAMHPYELHRTICKAFENPEEARILFRADADRPGEVHVIVQSLVAPEWDRVIAKDGYITDKDEPKQVELTGLRAGLPLRFRLRCRPSKRVGEPGSPDVGKRKSLKDKDEIFDWLHRKGEESGFEVKDVGFDRVYWYESREGKQEKPLGAVQFDGVLIVTDPDKLREAVRNGIGPQKAYGFGLLSLAPLDS
ncbi:MAG TPA: type I-E CRISPR-associated protein Cas6/Cse3/CasE [Fimbriimonadaceae bacterium]|nr:type I-E CRISPR-associated protein Cas6/Cse3/CasE [Fimbriimonadaceae bacterium]